jgi:hypothetical protein
MGETETPDAPTEEDEDAVLVPAEDPDEEPQEPVSVAVEPTLSLEEFGLLDGLTPPVLAGLRRWVQATGHPRYGTAREWQEALRQMQAYTPH